ncbi:hypothetical protein BDN72DRAFT_806866 [Pluteus cervinus]|uniref:Uncharacterized protein n=1 Tax=Pluteus cervinus TaxID=181527 RepID=A0ACD3BF78_9AGAR|nr:hypothetical protein BDN72DRAFT_806866 [Pluteus cervinus]
MTSVQIRTLLTPPSTDQADEKTTNFVNSHFRSLQDLHALEDTIEHVGKQNDVLQTKFTTSQQDLDQLLQQTRSSTDEHLHTAQELSLLRHSLADELLSLSEELVSTMSDEEYQPTLLEDIETIHRNLKELESVKGFLQVLEHALKLSELACQQVRDASGISLSTLQGYQSLQSFVTKVSDSCSTVEDGSGKQTLHLVNFLTRVEEKSWMSIKAILSSALLTASEKIGWPTPVDYALVAPADRNAFERAFLDLLRLQSFGEKIGVSRRIKEKDGLYAVQTLVQPVSLRFKFHFEGDRQTNRLDKPEWYFTHILNVIHEQKQFMDTIIQIFISSTEYKRISASREFIYLLFPILHRKLRHTVPKMLSLPSVLAHTIYQTLSFDAAVIEEGFMLQGTSGAKTTQSESGEEWPGVAQVILGNRHWFEAWVTGEQQFTEDQYLELISSADAWLIMDDNGDHEEASHSSTKVTNSARRLKALIEQVTDRYSPLPRFDQRVRFLTTVQLPLLDSYRGRISSSLDAFETLSSAFVRAVPGALPVSLGGRDEHTVKVDARGLTTGVDGAQRLCKALLSAKYIGATLSSLGEELFFLELWTEISVSPSLRSQVEGNPLLPTPTSLEGDIPQNTLFERLAAEYQHLVHRSEDLIVQQVCGEVEAGFKAHMNATIPSRNSPKSEDDIAVSQTLLVPIALLSSYLTFIGSTLPLSAVTASYRRIASRLSKHFLERQIVYREHFTPPEGITILTECELWIETCHAALAGKLPGGRNRVEAPWSTFLQASRLVALQGIAWEQAVEVTFSDTHSDEEWDDVITGLVGFNEFKNQEVRQILARREDCEPEA